MAFRSAFVTLIACLMMGSVPARATAGEEPVWKYDVIVTDPGTRSEARTGVLTYGDVTILPYFTELVTPIGCFVYSARIFRWGDAGWVEQEHNALDPVDLDEAITAEELDRGWYSCEAGTSKPGTPEHWFWTPTFNLRVDPAKLDAFVADHFSRAHWSYVLKQGSAGAVVGSLTYRDTPIPHSVEKILTPIGEFYVPGMQDGAAGRPVCWMLFSNKVLDKVPAGSNPINEATIARGLFDESVELLDVALPEHWVYLPDKRWWIDPTKIGEHFKDPTPIRPAIQVDSKLISKDEEPPQDR
ncbi:MAG: hypothetical protein JW889_07965 [Verrucomicrobia bacterium]|nr:hypothetical protein [Verrucomicrobiota bacterium]